MALNWSTFALEILNFLVLVWILKRFLYQPVLAVIAKRRAGIEKTLADAKAMQGEAEALRSRYEGRLRDWEQERQKAQAALAQELERERARAKEQLKAELERERDKARTAQARREAELRRALEGQALEQASRFAARVLEAVAGPELEARLVALAVSELSRLGTERVAALRGQWGEAPQAIVVHSAYPLETEQRQDLERVLHSVTGRAAPVRFEQDKSLLAGLRIEIGPWVLGANLADELKAFADWEHGH